MVLGLGFRRAEVHTQGLQACCSKASRFSGLGTLKPFGLQNFGPKTPEFGYLDPYGSSPGFDNA